MSLAGGRAAAGDSIVERGGSGAGRLILLYHYSWEARLVAGKMKYPHKIFAEFEQCLQCISL